MYVQEENIVLDNGVIHLCLYKKFYKFLILVFIYEICWIREKKKKIFDVAPPHGHCTAIK